jgi:hypothetical protein
MNHWLEVRHFEPESSSLEAIKESTDWLIAYRRRTLNSDRVPWKQLQGIPEIRHNVRAIHFYAADDATSFVCEDLYRYL